MQSWRTRHREIIADTEADAMVRMARLRSLGEEIRAAPIPERVLLRRIAIDLLTLESERLAAHQGAGTEASAETRKAAEDSQA